LGLISPAADIRRGLTNVGAALPISEISVEVLYTDFSLQKGSLNPTPVPAGKLPKFTTTDLRSC